MHKLQKILLKRLLLSNYQRYSSLTQGYGFEDNIVFHLKQLLVKGFIVKQDSKYVLTTKGAKEITKYDFNSLEDTGYKTFFIGIACKCGNEYLIKEHPADKANFYNLPSGKPCFGEDINEALPRIFYENTNLKLNSNNFKYLTLHLKTIKTMKGEVLFDDAFAIYKIEVNNDRKSKMKLHKQIKWRSVEEIQKLPNRWPEIDICINQKNINHYLSYGVVSNYLL